ncbi:MAG: acetyl-CoA carboxylase biotin carboxylase subunit [Candidatus Binatia bacterium]|nr:acetyl-CoA carboxylase biotin carboxylase subunit [Candidatus Binatia bacterium]
MPSFSTLLVANRGEIALRIMRTAHAQGLRTVAVYSDADADAPHVKYADDAVHIGPSPVGESYLVAEKILNAAKASGAEAIHPGYGFLSENAAFARAVEAAGLTFVGPPANAIDVMGDKARAKRAMIEAGVPCVPGYQGEDQSDERLIVEADGIGFPVMVKAAAGGGGRGMRLVPSADRLGSALKRARSEAERAFGSGELILEKAIVRPRHVEVQVFADGHGNTIHLGERDCSVQRRHQKVIEEAPCPVMTPALRDAMGSAATHAARAVDYRGAGTVEFLLDEGGGFYFLEMNTRLQVEHPVTEMVTGLDLVAMQLQVARGAALDVTQEEVRLDGHAIEVRFYTEDPEASFLPSTGPILLWHPPGGDGIRVDGGIKTGGEVSPFYDAMVAKIVAHGATREDARRRLIRALERTSLFGPKTNRDFLIDALGQPAFAAGDATTAFIEETYGKSGFESGEIPASAHAAAAAIQRNLARERARAEALAISPELLEWSSAGVLESVVQYEIGENRVTIPVESYADGAYDVRVADSAFRIAITTLRSETAHVIIDGRGVDAIFHEDRQRTLHVSFGPRSYVFTDLSAATSTGEDTAASGRVVAPMHGRLLQILVSEGQAVKKGDRLAILEAMKMQHEILAEVDGSVTTISAKAETQIGAGDLLLEIEPA